MALLERLEIVIEADARTAEREFDRIGRQATESLESIETAAAEVGDNASKRLADAAPEFARAGERLSDAAGRELDLSAAAERAAADLPRAVDSQRQEMEQAGRRAGDAAGGGVADGVRGAGAQVRGAGDRLGGEVGDGVSGGILESLGGLGGDLSGAMDDALGALPAGVAGPAAAAGAAIGVAIVGGIAGAIENESLGDIVAARVGEGAAESQRFADVTAGVFRDAWGQSKAEVADAVDAVYSSLEDSRGSEEALQRLTTKAQALADVYGIDVQQAVAAVDQVQFNGLADSADEAFDIITAGLQDVASYTRDEVLEALNEYADDFGNLGINGARAMDILASAAEGGAFGVDKAGDAVKELALRVANLNDVAAQGRLEDLGLDAQQMASDVAAGGELADEAIQTIAQRLLEIEDPAEQYTAALDLFGTQYEDLGRRLGPEFIAALAGQGDAMTNAAGASDRLVDSLDNQATAWEQLKREIGGLFEEYGSGLTGPLDAFIDVRDAMESEGEEWQDVLSKLGVDLGTTFLDSLSDTLDRTPFGGTISGSFNWWAERLGVDNLTDVVGVIGGILSGDGTPAEDGSFLWDNIDPPELGLDDVESDGNAAATAIGNLNAELAQSGELAEIAGQRTANYLDAIGNSTNLDNAISAQLELRDAAYQLADGLGALQGVDIQAFADGTIQVSDEAADALGDIAGAASAAQQQIANTLQWEGDDAARQAAAELRDQFVGIFEAAGLSDDQVNDLLESMGLLDPQVDMAITLSGVEEVLAQTSLIRDLLIGTDAEIPDVINKQIALALSEERYQDARNLQNLWLEDMQNGLIENPLLIRMGLGETDTASGEIEGFKRDEENGRPARIPVDANTEPARGSVGRLMRDIGLLRPVIQVGANVTSATNAIAQAGVAAAEVRAGVDLNGNGIVGRAVGGRTLAGATYEINERGTELVTMDDNGFVVNASNFKQLMDNMQRLVDGVGGGGMQVVQNITAPGPMEAASESARKLRDASYLVGV